LQAAGKSGDVERGGHRAIAKRCGQSFQPDHMVRSLEVSASRQRS
jgi:hypothetical protein